MDDVEVKKFKDLIIENENSETLQSAVEYFDSIDDFDELARIYDLVLKQNPEDTNALTQLGIIYADYYKDYQKAAEYFNRILVINDKDAGTYYQLGRLSEYKSNYEEAIKYYLKAIEIDSKNVLSYINLSWLYLEQYDDINTSYILVEEALKYVEHSDIYTHMAYIEFRKYNNEDLAIEHLNKAIELDRENDLAYTYLGQIYTEREQFDLAKSLYELAINLPNINELLVHEYCKLLIVEYKAFNEAVNVLKRAIDYYPKSVIYYAYIANLYFVLGKHLEAKQYLELAEDFEVTSQEALLMIGYLKIMLDSDTDGALMYFEKVIEINPTNLNALSFVGFYNLINKNNIDAALEYFIKIAEISKGNFVIHFIIAQIYLQYYQDYSKALEYLHEIDEKLLTKTEKSHLNFVIGNIYEKFVDDKYQALEYYELAYQIKPHEYLKEVINRIYESDKTIIN